MQSFLFVHTDVSVDVVLKLLDFDAYNEYKFLNEYPLLTVLAAHPNPSADLLQGINIYLQAKPYDFAYLNKLYLIYSTLIRTHCTKFACSNDQLVKKKNIFDQYNILNLI